MDSILQKPQFSKFTAEDIQSVVASNDKQRYHLETDADTGRLKIRANQGHTLAVCLHLGQFSVEYVPAMGTCGGRSFQF